MIARANTWPVSQGRQLLQADNFWRGQCLLSICKSIISPPRAQSPPPYYISKFSIIIRKHYTLYIIHYFIDIMRGHKPLRDWCLLFGRDGGPFGTTIPSVWRPRGTPIPSDNIYFFLVAVFERLWNKEF